MNWLLTFFFLNSTIPLQDTCTNSADLKIWNSGGKDNFKDYMNECGKECLGNNDCTTNCVQKAEGYSHLCSQCFGNIGECTVKNCLMDCMNGDTPTCEKCIASHCDDSFHTCSGLSIPPPKYLRGSL